MKSPHPGPVRPCAVLALFLLAAATAADAAVVKCVDADGNVTYQDSPCGQGQAGRAVELPKAESREDVSAWESAAREARVVRGMPKRWVLQARGAPLEIRPPVAREDATEVWRYGGKDGGLLVGFAGPNVTWVRADAAAGAAAAANPAPAPVGATDGGATRGAQNRRFVIAGRYCEYVFAEIGAADRQEAVPAAAGGGAGIRYYYDPKPGDPNMRTAFTCQDGKVADVERTVVQ